MGNNNGEDGNANPQAGPRAVARVRGAARSAWDDLRKRERGAEALAGKDGRYPPRYRKLLEQYYEHLNKTETSNP